jgi:hypothetical protein
MNRRHEAHDEVSASVSATARAASLDDDDNNNNDDKDDEEEPCSKATARATVGTTAAGVNITSAVMEGWARQHTARHTVRHPFQ